ncbi:hypothetical protein CY35_03G001700 [Sphagnum magellanicum]|nr:hypothetical protein CY35_03G001700 [Sphagnum magellanicum]KAH9566909.1 hypothetical protein CY35_03G001700 [Sphagnum magellanicum]
MEICMGPSTAIMVIAVLGAFLCSVSVPCVWAQNPTGSVFIDCGSTVSYVDPVTNMRWETDAPKYITKGVNAFVPSAKATYPDLSELTTVRYFPDSLPRKNCYSLPVTPNNTYLIRATFFYGSYDNATTLPSFQMAIDGTIVANVTFGNATAFVYHEFGFLSRLNASVIFLCLSRDSSNSVPFISAISLSSPLPADFYLVYDVNFLHERTYYHTKYRLNFGADRLVRYPDDIFDRYWFPEGVNSTFVNMSTTPVQSLTNVSVIIDNYPLNFPPAVMETALTTKNSMRISFPDTISEGYLGLYFAELDPTANNYSRQFKIQIPQTSETQVINPYNFAGSLDNSSGFVFSDLVEVNYFDMIIDPYSNNSVALGPLVNALEFCELMQNEVALLTNDQDALTIEEIKSAYMDQLAEWTGDPCLPYPHPWVTCSSVDVTLNNPSILAVNLSRYNLTGPISSNFSNLLNLISLDLSGNQLTGSIPPSVWNMISQLHVLDVSENQLSGNFPSGINFTESNAQCPQSLAILKVFGNNFQGTFPPDLFNCSMCKLQEMLGGNPICSKENSAQTKSANQQLNCRYNSSNIAIELPTNSSTLHKLIWILSVTLSFFVILGALVFIIIFRKYRKNAFALQEIQKEFARQQVQPTLYSYNVLRAATREFHHDNKLGEGAFGVVYKGILPNGSKLAVKSLTKAHQGIDDFLNEVVAITDVKHNNLVKLKGCCLHGIQRYLVYEYVENKNLGEALWHDCQEGHHTLFLDWPRRFIICMDIAHGLTYLHEFLNPCIIHRDIKATNILLDMNLNAKIADFGLARLFPNDQTHIVTKYIAGTFGYLSPEYASLGELTTKVDVYSFGILLLEIISGRKSIDDTLPPEEMYLVKWAWSLHEKNMLINLVDQKLNDTIVEIELQRVTKVALLCVQHDSRRRPLMSRVLLMLQGEMEIEVAFGEFELQTNIYEKPQASCIDGSSSEINPLIF